MNELTDAPLAEKPEKMHVVGDVVHVPISPAGTEACVVTAVSPDGIVIVKRPNGRHFVAYYGPLLSGMFDVRRVTPSGGLAQRGERVWKYQVVERATW